MTVNELTTSKKELSKLQKQLGSEMSKGKYKDTNRINSLKKEIKNKKLEIGSITRDMVSQIIVDDN
jgi:hypothetical protein